LSGDTSKLNSYVGKEVQVHGKNTSRGATDADAMSSDASSAGAAKQFTVHDVKKLSDTCK